MRNSQESENRSQRDGLSGVAASRRITAREESQAGGLAQNQSGAKRYTDLWHAAFHRENNGTAGRYEWTSNPNRSAPRLNFLRGEPFH